MNKQLTVILAVTVLFGYLYSRMNPEDFGFKSPVDPYYFAFTTMSSVGYGDLSPKTNKAKIAVMLQQAIIIGEVVKLFII
jgi:hypothetical protein